MEALKASLENSSILKWFDPEPCKWNYITCRQNRVIRIQINYLSLGGSLPQDLQYRDALEILEVASNRLSGPIPSLAGLSYLKHAQFDKNFFSHVPFDFFRGLTSLRSISFDFNPNISSWEIPESLKDARGLKSFSANVACISGTIPDFFWADTFPRLRHLHLAMNNLHGKISSSFAKSSIQTLWLHDQNSDFKLHGSVAVLRNKTSLTKVRLAGNSFTGPLPDLSKLISLEELNLRYNWLTGVVPLSLANLPKLSNLYLAYNLLQGPTPAFVNSKLDSDIGKDANGFNSFCLDDPGVACDSGVEVLLSIAESMGYPLVFAKSWKGNDPCDSSRILERDLM
ncbi:receptor protein kinase TMK1-like [Pistacia vera]|uniref:receptor protein kinase TMK1-like n=1 Tax=Pistacia vera TaxID=55513 RepID=UPI001263B840|nr:receptor protein kinase TMK1-like [Pistacia vera]